MILIGRGLDLRKRVKRREWRVESKQAKASGDKAGHEDEHSGASGLWSGGIRGDAVEGVGREKFQRE